MHKRMDAFVYADTYLRFKRIDFVYLLPSLYGAYGLINIMDLANGKPIQIFFFL